MNSLDFSTEANQDVMDIRDLYPFYYPQHTAEKETSVMPVHLNELTWVNLQKEYPSSYDSNGNSALSENQLNDEENTHNLLMSFLEGDKNFEEEKTLSSALCGTIVEAHKIMLINAGVYSSIRRAKIDPLATITLKKMLLTKDWQAYHLVLLLEKGADPNTVYNENLDSLLHACVQNLNFIALKYAIVFGAELNKSNAMKHTALMTLCTQNDDENSTKINQIIKYLLKQTRINCECRDIQGKNAIMLGIESTNITAVRQLLRYGVAVTDSFPPFSSPYDLALLLYAKKLHIDASSISCKVKYLDEVIELPRGASSDTTYISRRKLFFDSFWKTQTEIIFCMVHHKKLLEEQVKIRNEKLQSLIPSAELKTTTSSTQSLHVGPLRQMRHKKTDIDDGSINSENSSHTDGLHLRDRVLSERDKKRCAKKLAARLQREEALEGRWVYAKGDVSVRVDSEFKTALYVKRPNNHDRQSDMTTAGHFPITASVQRIRHTTLSSTDVGNGMGASADTSRASASVSGRNAHQALPHKGSKRVADRTNNVKFIKSTSEKFSSTEIRRSNASARSSTSMKAITSSSFGAEAVMSSGHTHTNAAASVPSAFDDASLSREMYQRAQASSYVRSSVLRNGADAGFNRDSDQEPDGTQYVDDSGDDE